MQFSGVHKVNVGEAVVEEELEVEAEEVALDIVVVLISD